MESENGRLSDLVLAELAAFADGSLPPAERTRVAERVARSPHLQSLVAEQRASVMAVALLDVPTPPRLREAVAAVALRTAPEPPAATEGEPRVRRLLPRLPRLAIAGGLATVLASGALAVVVASAGAPSISDTVELGELGATAAAPAVSPRNDAWLAASVDGVAFPNYPRETGWQRSGRRVDEFDGREATTVYYRRGDEEAAYSIVSGEPLDWPDGARLAERDGVELRSLRYEGAMVVTWLRDGHTCVIASEDADTKELLELAAWTEKGKASA